MYGIQKSCWAYWNKDERLRYEDTLIDWIYALEDEFREKRARAIAAREKLIQIINSGEMNYKVIQEILTYDCRLNNHNIEQLSAKLLFDLTRNNGFEVSKVSAT